ncbi:MAG: HAMP domain-containing sensor histidine kinase [bacterium]
MKSPRNVLTTTQKLAFFYSFIVALSFFIVGIVFIIFSASVMHWVMESGLKKEGLDVVEKFLKIDGNIITLVKNEEGKSIDEYAVEELMGVLIYDDQGNEKGAFFTQGMKTGSHLAPNETLHGKDDVVSLEFDQATLLFSLPFSREKYYTHSIVVENNSKERVGVVTVFHLTTDTTMFINILWSVLIGIIFLALPFYWIIGLYMARKALRPVMIIQKQVESIASHKLETRLTLQGSEKDELVQLAQTFNNLLSRLDSAAKWQRQFILDMAHELKTPLAVMFTTLEVARDEEHNKEDLQQLFSSLLEDTQRMIRLTQTLLSTTRQQQNEGLDQQLTITSVSIAEIVDQFLKSYASTLRLKRLDIYATVDQSLTITTDKEKLLHCINNILDNAIKYSPDGKGITIATSQSDGHVYLRIADQGTGIDPAEQTKVFEQFYRSPVTSGAAPGVGLGLSLVKRYMALLQGSVRLESTPGNGTSVILELPAQFVKK